MLEVILLLMIAAICFVFYRSGKEAEQSKRLKDFLDAIKRAKEVDCMKDKEVEEAKDKYE